MSEPEKYEIKEEQKDEKVPEKEKKLIGEFLLCILWDIEASWWSRRQQRIIHGDSRTVEAMRSSYY